MSETWTEYAVRWGEIDHEFEPCADLERARRISAMHPWPSTVVGRTVTASDWLPVDGAQ